MVTLCKLFRVEDKFYRTKIKNQIVGDEIGFKREVDFYLFNPEYEEEYKCEVKLMGRGNPESADAVIARGSKVFVADKLSDTNKRQLDSLNVEWVELRKDEGFRRFSLVLSNLNIPHIQFKGELEDKLELIYRSIFK